MMPLEYRQLQRTLGVTAPRAFGLALCQPSNASAGFAERSIKRVGETVRSRPDGNPRLILFVPPQLFEAKRAVATAKELYSTFAVRTRERLHGGAFHIAIARVHA